MKKKTTKKKATKPLSLFEQLANLSPDLRAKVGQAYAEKHRAERACRARVVRADLSGTASDVAHAIATLLSDEPAKTFTS